MSLREAEPVFYLGVRAKGYPTRGVTLHRDQCTSRARSRRFRTCAIFYCVLYTKPFTELSSGDTLIAGGKGASLGEMTQAGVPVPPGFVVLTDAFERVNTHLCITG